MLVNVIFSHCSIVASLEAEQSVVIRRSSPRQLLTNPLSTDLVLFKQPHSTASARRCNQADIDDATTIRPPGQQSHGQRSGNWFTGACIDAGAYPEPYTTGARPRYIWHQCSPLLSGPAVFPASSTPNPSPCFSLCTFETEVDRPWPTWLNGPNATSRQR
jgi:hypothetical protein